MSVLDMSLNNLMISSSNAGSFTLSNIFNTYISDIGIMVRVFANGPGDLGSIPIRVIPKT